MRRKEILYLPNNEAPLQLVQWGVARWERAVSSPWLEKEAE